MSHRILIIMLIAACAFAQAPQSQKPAPSAHPSATPTGPESAPPQTEQPKAKPEDLPADAPVVTLDGFCEKPAAGASAADCKTVITKEQFEKLSQALQPNMPMNTKRQLAVAMARARVLSKAATEQGLENTPQGKQILSFTREQALGQMLLMHIQQEAANVPQDEVQKYYKDHTAEFTQANLKRIFIPKSTASGKAPDPAEIKTFAEQIRARAAAGEDFDKLQKEAYEHTGIKTEAPPTETKNMHKDNLPPAQASVFDLKPDEMSQLIDEPGGFYIYKMESKTEAPLEQVAPQIKQTIERQTVQQQMESLTKTIKPVMNPAYFGAEGEGQPGAVRPMSPQERPTPKQ